MPAPESLRPPAGILVEIRQGGRLVAALPLGDDTIEVTLRDVRSGLPLGSLTARGPVLGRIDEQPLPSIARAPSDDFTMPLPETTHTASRSPAEPTGDLDHDEPETETAEAPHPASRRRVPNLAGNLWSGATDEPTSPAMVPRHVSLADEESSLTIPRPTALSPEPQPGEHTVSRHLESLDDEGTLSSLLEEVHTGATVPPAEVWTRNASEWRSAGRLKPGQLAKARRGWVRLETDGRLVVSPGPELAGTATMVDGTTIEIQKGSQRVRLPAGSSIILRGPGHGLYVRADPPLPGH